MNLRTMKPRDLAQLDRLQRIAYGEYFLESTDVILDKIQVASQSCFVLEDTVDNNDVLRAYTISHPYHNQQVPPLDQPLNPEYCTPSTNWYLHDLALDVGVRGQGIAQQLLDQVFIFARNQHCQSIALVAVQNSVPFWQKQGFAVTQPQPNVASYGADARYMQRLL